MAYFANAAGQEKDRLKREGSNLEKHQDARKAKKGEANGQRREARRASVSHLYPLLR
jgi:hypothetical protein